MRKRRGYIIPLFFLVLTTLPVLIMGSLQAFQALIRIRMEKALTEDPLHIVRLPVAEVKWYEAEKEILVDGKMFDISQYSIEDGVFIAEGIFDEEETAVVSFMNGHWSEQEQAHLLIRLLLLSHCLLLLRLYIPAFHFNFRRPEGFPGYILHYSAPELSITAPPPKALFSFV